MRNKNLHGRVARLTVCASNDLLANVRFVEHTEVCEFDSRAGTWHDIPAKPDSIGTILIYATDRSSYTEIRGELAQRFIMLEC